MLSLIVFEEFVFVGLVFYFGDVGFGVLELVQADFELEVEILLNILLMLLTTHNHLRRRQVRMAPDPELLEIS